MTINGPSRVLGGGATFPAQAHDEAWCAERAVRERVDGPVSISGWFRVMNSKDFDFFSVLSIAYSSDK
jgi:hypothetical protein